jgi:hypothetical protein
MTSSHWQRAEMCRIAPNLVTIGRSAILHPELPSAVAGGSTPAP